MNYSCFKRSTLGGFTECKTVTLVIHVIFVPKSTFWNSYNTDIFKAIIILLEVKLIELPHEFKTSKKVGETY